MQKEHWDPLFAWVKQKFGVEVAIADGLAPARQSKATNQKMTEILEEMDVWELAGELEERCARERADNLAFERAAYASKSFIIALALCRGHLTAEQASQASHVEVRSQIEIWGEVEDSQFVVLGGKTRLLTTSP